MRGEEMQNPWRHKLALIESLTPEEMIQIYPTEFIAILSCSKIPETIFNRVMSGQPTEGIEILEEQAHLICNRYLSIAVLQQILQTSPFAWIREIAASRIYVKQNSNQIALSIIRLARKD